MPMRRSTSVTLEGVSKVFHDKQAGRDVTAVEPCSFTIEPGELVTLLGPSGCGKTTMLRMIGGFELPTTGRVLLDNEDVTALPPNKRDTAMVFQSYGLFPHMNVFENVAYGLRLRKVPMNEIRIRVEKFLKLVGLEELAMRPPSRLSGGQQQRVALARTLAQNPKIILADEPVAALDPVTAKQVMEDFVRINKEMGISILLNIHHVELALEYADRIIGIRAGKIVYDGPAEKVDQQVLSSIYGDELPREEAEA